MKALTITIWGVAGLLVAAGLSLLATSKDIPEIGRHFLPHHRATYAAIAAGVGAAAGVCVGRGVVWMTRD